MPTFRHKVEYFPVWLMATAIGVLPRSLARAFCQGIGLLMYTAHRRLRKVGLRNLDLAFPEKTRKEKLQILRTLFKGLGRQLAEFALSSQRFRQFSAAIQDSGSRLGNSTPAHRSACDRPDRQALGGRPGLVDNPAFTLRRASHAEIRD